MKVQPDTNHLWSNLPGYDLSFSVLPTNKGAAGRFLHSWGDLDHKGSAEYDPCGWVTSPFGKAGDVLWVREAWRFYNWQFDKGICGIEYRDGQRQVCEQMQITEKQLETYWQQCTDDCEKAGAKLLPDENRYWLDDMPLPTRWRPSIHMPRWACRTKLPNKRVWLERVQEISEEDAQAEGVLIVPHDGQDWTIDDPCRRQFADLWHSIYGTWDANPWVWCSEFEVQA
jgi:hypothetical protein